MTETEGEALNRLKSSYGTGKPYIGGQGTAQKPDPYKIGIAGMRRSAIPYSFYSKSQRVGHASILDRDVIEENMRKHERRNKGGFGMVFTDEKGSPVPYAVFNDPATHLAFAADENGKILCIDGEALEIEAEQKETQDKYVAHILRLALVSDDACMRVLGMTDDEDNFYKMCLPGGGKNKGVPPSLINADCTPALLEALNADSKEYSMGVAKLRCIVRAALPMISMTTKTRQNLEKDDT